MKILVACEESQAVTTELRRLGHEAYSCDILDCSGGHPEWHVKDDVLPLLHPTMNFQGLSAEFYGVYFQTCDGARHYIAGKWDMIIAFPPCTHLAVSGARHFEKKRADGRQREGLEFFCQFLTADCPRVAIENPINIISGDYCLEWFPEIAERYGLPRKPDQIIQPWQFGDAFEKKTSLWLKGLPPLTPTDIVPVPERQVMPSGKTMPAWYSKKGSRDNPNNQSRQTMRSKTFPGIAKAMADQWAGRTEMRE